MKLDRPLKFYTKKELIEGKHNKERNIVQEVQDELIIYNLLDVSGEAPVMRSIHDFTEVFNLGSTYIVQDRIAEANREFVELILKSEIPFILESLTNHKDNTPIDDTIYVHTEVRDEK